MPQPRARVAIFVFDLSATGVVRNALALAGALGTAHDVEIVACRSGAMARRASTVPVTVLGDGGRIGPLALVGLAAALRAHVAATHPQLMISAGNRGHPLFLAALKGLRGFRRIYRFSNDIDHARGPRRKGIATRLGDAAQLALLAGDADRIVLVSSHLLADRRLAAAAARGQAVVIENGVDVDLIRARAAAPLDHPFVATDAPPFVLAMGRFAAQKNFPTLIDAVGHANRTRPLGLVILGTGPDAARDALLGLARGHGLGDRLLLPGVIDNPFPWLARAGAFALPSWWEGASNALLEALACGTPIVASTRAGNAASVLAGGDYGILADPGDVAAWAAALLRQTGPVARRVLPGDRADAWRLDRTLATWRALVDAELQRGAH